MIVKTEYARIATCRDEKEARDFLRMAEENYPVQNFSIIPDDGWYVVRMQRKKTTQDVDVQLIRSFAAGYFECIRQHRLAA